MKHIADILHGMYNEAMLHDNQEDYSIEKQAAWLETYKINPIQLGRMCEKYPTLLTSWEQFKTVYEMCRSQDDNNQQNS